jgi:CubicO group peptidase (beta-lactamase class C family)
MNSNNNVDHLFAGYSDCEGPGAAVMVIQDGTILLKRFYGLADVDLKVAIGDDTQFLLASVTKQFTAMAIMILQENNRLRYDDPLSEFFNHFPSYAEKITVRHLLNHTSGLPEFDCLFVKAGSIDVDWPRSSRWPPSGYEPTSKDVLNLLARQPTLRFNPGDRFEYDNSGYVVLAQIVEEVSGMRFAQFVHQEIFDKIGMSHSIVFDETKPVVPNRARSYTEAVCGKYREIDYTPLNLIYGEDGIYTTIDDMFLWDQALESEVLVKHETLMEAFSPRRLNCGNCTTYGFGWDFGQTLQYADISHDGWWVGFRTYILRLLSCRFSVVVLANCAGIEASKLGDEIAKIYLR